MKKVHVRFTRTHLAFPAVMKRNRFGFTVTVISAFAAIVACSNSQQRLAAKINRQTGNAPAVAAKQAATLCSAQIPRGGKLLPKAGTAVSICKIPDLTDVEPIIDGDSATKVTATDDQLASHPVKFSVSPIKGRLIIALNIGLGFTKEVSAANQQVTANWINTKCVKEIGGLWKSSKQPVDLVIKVLPADAYTKDPPDQKVELQLASKTDGTKLDGSQPLTYIAFNMTQWPHRAYLFPRAKDIKDAPKKKYAKDSNRRFCQSFAVLVGNFLGLESDHTKEAPKCAAESAALSVPGATPVPVVAQPTATPTPEPTLESTPDESDASDSAISESSFEDIAKPAAPKDQPFMTNAIDPDNAPASFWKTATFSVSDLKTILHSACDSVDKPAVVPPAKPVTPSKPGASPTPAPSPSPTPDENETWL
jgi:hypothetical protein